MLPNMVERPRQKSMTKKRMAQIGETGMLMMASVNTMKARPVPSTPWGRTHPKKYSPSVSYSTYWYYMMMIRTIAIVCFHRMWQLRQIWLVVGTLYRALRSAGLKPFAVQIFGPDDSNYGPVVTSAGRYWAFRPPFWPIRMKNTGVRCCDVAYSPDWGKSACRSSVNWALQGCPDLSGWDTSECRRSCCLWCCFQGSWRCWATSRCFCNEEISVKSVNHTRTVYF